MFPCPLGILALRLCRSVGDFFEGEKNEEKEGEGGRKKRGGEKGGERKEGGKSLFLQGLYIISTYTVLF